MTQQLKRSWWRRRSSPPNCREVGRVLQSYLDRELTEADAEAVASHLEDCRRCGLEVDTYTHIKQALGSTGTTELDADALARLRSFGERLAGGDAPADKA